MWSVLGSASSIQAAYEELLQEYEVEPARLRVDLEEFVGQLLGQKLIEAGPKPEGSHGHGMSGFVAMLNLNGSPVDRSLLWSDDGLPGVSRAGWQRVRAIEHVGFGHALLKLNEESAPEEQPFTLDGRRWIVADARVDARQDSHRRTRSAGAGARHRRCHGCGIDPSRLLCLG